MAEGLLGTAEIAQIRADAAAAACSLSCTIKRKAITRDAYGTETDTFNTVTTVNVGMKEPTAAQLQNYDYLIGSLAAWQIQLPYGTDVKHQDHLLIGTDTLVVQVDLSPQSYNMLTTVLATEVR